MTRASRQRVAAIAYGAILLAGFFLLFRPEARIKHVIAPIPMPEVVRKIEERWPAPIPTPDPEPVVVETAPQPSDEGEKINMPTPQPVATPGPKPAKRRALVKQRRPRAPIPFIFEADEQIEGEADYVDNSWLAQFFRAAARRAGAID